MGERVRARGAAEADGVRVTVLAGGVGGAKMAHGLAMLAADSSRSDERIQLTVVGNVADDLEVHGLHVSPDLDTVMYTLAGLANPDTGWGLREETWSAAEMLERYGAPTWFRLGDRDLATSIVRTARLRSGDRLTAITADLTRSLGVDARLLPATDAPVRTKVLTDGGWLDFQDYFVRRGQRDEVRELRYDGLDAAQPTAEVLEAISGADVIVIAPSNPFLSIAPILGIQRVADAVRASGAAVVAVSPIVAGAALRGPADRLFTSLGGEPSALSVARHYVERYPGVVDGLVIDRVDRSQSAGIEAMRVRVLATGTVMRSDSDRERLASETVAFAKTLGSPRSHTS
jgi:LPPG:FO 2-phospho-L-lactate transferase